MMGVDDELFVILGAKKHDVLYTDPQDWISVTEVDRRLLNLSDFIRASIGGLITKADFQKARSIMLGEE